MSILYQKASPFECSKETTNLVLLSIPYSNVTSTPTNKNNAGWRNTRTLRCPSWGEASLCRLRNLIAFENNRVFRYYREALSDETKKFHLDRYRDFFSRLRPRLFLRPNIFETMTETFFETKCFRDRYRDFF